MAQNTTSNRGYDDTVYIPRQQRLRPMILTRKVQQFYLVYLCFPDGSEMQIAAYMMPNDGNWRANDAFMTVWYRFTKSGSEVFHNNAFPASHGAVVPFLYHGFFFQHFSNINFFILKSNFQNLI